VFMGHVTLCKDESKHSPSMHTVTFTIDKDNSMSRPLARGHDRVRVQVGYIYGVSAFRTAYSTRRRAGASNLRAHTSCTRTHQHQHAIWNPFCPCGTHAK
jgi:hypothetical protein